MKSTQIGDRHIQKVSSKVNKIIALIIPPHQIDKDQMLAFPERTLSGNHQEVYAGVPLDGINCISELHFYVPIHISSHRSVSIYTGRMAPHDPS